MPALNGHENDKQPNGGHVKHEPPKPESKPRKRVAKNPTPALR